MAAQAEPRMPTRPKSAPPPLSCDAHTHVFAPTSEVALAFPPSYEPPLAPASLQRDMLNAVGVDRAVIVQPAPYGLDASVLIAALRAGEGRLKGVATARSDCPDAALETLRAAGVCALRFTEARLPSGERYRGSVELAEFPRLAPRMMEHGMHAQLWPGPDGVAELLDAALAHGVTLVLEHMGGVDIRRGVQHPTFQLLLSLLREGRIWIKLTVCRRSTAAPSYPDLRPFHDALVEANPRRLVWGSDWPFVRMDERAPDVGRLLDLFAEWVGDADVRRAILVDNPRSLYGFE